MFYIIPTKRGLGVELWGSYDDIRTIHSIIGKFWNQEAFLAKKGFDNRDKLISGFSYVIRKAYEGSQLTRVHGHYSYEQIPQFGCQISWIHFLFSLSALRTNMHYIESDKYDLGIFLQLEHELEIAMRKFDEQGARQLQHFISDGIYMANPYLYQFMRSINADYFELRGGKTAFRKLSKMLKRAMYGTDKYNEYNAFLTVEAQRLNCDINDLELTDDHIDYENIKW